MRTDGKKQTQKSLDFFFIIFPKQIIINKIMTLCLQKIIEITALAMLYDKLFSRFFFFLSDCVSATVYQVYLFIFTSSRDCKKTYFEHNFKILIIHYFLENE